MYICYKIACNVAVFFYKTISFLHERKTLEKNRKSRIKCPIMHKSAVPNSNLLSPSPVTDFLWGKYSPQLLKRKTYFVLRHFCCGLCFHFCQIPLCWTCCPSTCPFPNILLLPPCASPSKGTCFFISRVCSSICEIEGLCWVPKGLSIQGSAL